MTAALLLMLAQDPEALAAAGVELAQGRQFAEAEKMWRQALASAPALFSANFNLGYLLFNQSRFEAAEPFLSRAVKTQPKDFNARFILGSALSRLNRTDDALRHWRAALALRPDHVKLMQVMAVEYGKGQYFGEAATVAERALGLKDDDPEVWLIAIKSWQDAGDHAAALRVAQSMARRFPEHPRAAFEYGFELYRNGRPEEAMPLIRRALAAQPPWEEPFYFLGDILAREGREQEAIPLLERAVALRPDYMAARLALARALMQSGRDDDAKRELLRAAETDPKHPQPHLLLAQLYFRLGDEAAAAAARAQSAQLRKASPQSVEAPQSRPFPQPGPAR